MNTISMKKFGGMGRFGNQLFQYAFLKAYAQKHGCELQIPPWVGQYLFGLSDLAVVESLPRFKEKGTKPWYAYTQPPLQDELVNHDFYGYAQYHTKHYVQNKLDWFRWFSPIEEVETRLLLAVEKLQSYKRPIIGIHLRRGDYGQIHFYITPVSWYLECLKNMGIEKPILFIATETPELIKEFTDEGYEVETFKTLGIELLEKLPNYNYLSADEEKREEWQMDFYPDFYLLSRCDHLLIPNSTFSFAAAMLNRELESCWRSSLSEGKFSKIDPWDAQPLERESVDDHPRPGTFLESNLPYWKRRKTATRK